MYVCMCLCDELLVVYLSLRKYKYMYVSTDSIYTYSLLNMYYMYLNDMLLCVFVCWIIKSCIICMGHICTCICTCISIHCMYLSCVFVWWNSHEKFVFFLLVHVHTYIVYLHKCICSTYTWICTYMYVHVHVCICTILHGLPVVHTT